MYMTNMYTLLTKGLGYETKELPVTPICIHLGKNNHHLSFGSLGKSLLMIEWLIYRNSTQDFVCIVVKYV